MTKQERSITIDCRPRVLIVDNDPMVRRLQVLNVRKEGYEPIEAIGVGDVLVNDAIQKARDHCCHVAIVDMKLYDDYSHLDRSGLELIGALHPTKSIIFSGSGNDRDTAKMAINKGAFDFIGKEQNPDDLVDALNRAVKSMFACNHGPRVQISQVITRQIAMDIPFKSGQIRELLKSLHPSAGLITVEPIGGASRTENSSLRRRSVVLKVREDQKEPSVVKVSPRKNALKEFENFGAHIKGWIPDNFYAHIEDHQFRWHIGGVNYKFIGGGLVGFELFTNYYRKCSPENICDVLIHLFKHTWGQRYKSSPPVPLSGHSLFDAYSHVWNRDHWIRTLQDYINDSDEVFHICELEQTFDNPAHWVFKRTNLGRTPEDDQSSLPPSLMAITHGDMLGDNFFVDEKKQAWVIDYERVGWGPILQDFVLLELDILVRLAELADIDRLSVYQLLISLMTRTPPNRDTRLGFGNESITKAYTVIAQLRELAQDFIVGQDWRAYFWGVLLNSVFRINLLHEKIESIGDGEQQNSNSVSRQALGMRKEQELALLVGSIICRILDSWDQQVLPVYQSKESELVIDDEVFQNDYSNLLGLLAHDEKSILLQSAYGLNLETRNVIRDMWQALDDNNELLQELSETLYLIQQDILSIQSTNNLAEIAEASQLASRLIENSTLDVRHRIKVMLPIIPLLLSYESDLDINSALNLSVAWQKLKERLVDYYSDKS